MSSTNLRSQSHAMRAAIVFTTSLTVLGFMATPAIADRRTPAPIVFSGQGTRTAPTQGVTQTQTAPKLSRRERRAARRAAKNTPAQAEPTRRVEFRYPDQPDTFYGAGGARSDVNAAPLSFSSSTSAISQAEASKYTVGTAPSPSPAPKVTAPTRVDPAITSGGFDARAAAARVAEQPKPTLVSSAGPADFSSAPLPMLQEVVAETNTPATKPVSGTAFQPQQGAVYDQTGNASVFNPALNGQPTSNGEILDTQAMVAAHPSLPLPSLVQVINLENNREVVLRVNDRGPIGGNGLIEVSERAADVLGFAQTAQANVRVKYLGQAPQVSGQPSPVVAAETPRPIQTAAANSSANTLFGAPTQSLPTTPAPTTSSEQFVVQLASFTDIGNAQRLHASLGGYVGNLGIVPVNVDGTDYFRVVAGPLDDRRSAESLRDQLANQGIGRGLVIAAP